MMKGIEVTAFDLAQRFVGLKEVAGAVSNPQILAMLRLDDDWPTDDAVPWCSAFVNYICWLLRLPRSKSLAARSWLPIGQVVSNESVAVPGFDIVILSREGNPLSGHVGFYAGFDVVDTRRVYVLGGNQNNQVSVEPFHYSRVIGVRRLLEVA